MKGVKPGFLSGIKAPKFMEKFKSMEFGSSKTVVALEIGNDWLKIVQKSRANGGKDTYIVDISKLSMIKDSVAAAIAQIFKDLKLDRKHVVAYIPRHLVTVRMLELPTTDAKEISDMINLQIGKQTPYSKDEIVSSHRTVEIAQSGYSKVMLVIAARNIINERTDTLAKAGLSVERVAISSEGVYNWFRAAHMKDLKLEKFQGVAIVDIDSNYSDFIVVRGANMVFTRNIFIGSNHLMQDVGDWRDKFIDELKRSFERYQIEEKNVKIVKMFLSGSASNIKELDIVLARAMNMPVENIYQLKDVDVRNGKNITQNDDFRFVSLTQLLGVSSGAKEDEIDLSTSEQKIRGMIDTKRRQLTLMGALVVAIVTVLSLLVFTSIYNKSVYLAKLKTMISRIETEAGGVEKMRNVINLVEKRLDARGSSIEVITEIYKITPKEIHLTDINIDEKRTIVLKGGGSAMSDVFKYVKTLEGSNMFENVRTTYTTTKKDNNNSEFAEFEISCNYQD